MIKESLDLLRESECSNIMIVSSITGTYPDYHMGVYAMTKAALDNMVKFLSDELRTFDIRINGIAPGLVATELSGPIWKGNNQINEKGVGRPEEVAAVVATVCSEDGTFMNGEIYRVHGGFPHL